MAAVEPQRRPEPRSASGGLEAVFLEHLELVERVARFAARRAGFPAQDVEDFVSTVTVKLIDDDYAVFRKHRGESSLPTFLTTVVHNLFHDFRNQKWGKFRPSAKARRLGPAALALERLLVRDQQDLETAIRILEGRPEIEESGDRLRELAAELPSRTTRTFVGEEVLEQRASTAPEASVERRAEDRERQAGAVRIERLLDVALRSLDPQDLLILKMIFRDGCSIATIATALRLEQRPLYSRRDRCLKELQAVLAAEGLTWPEVRDILGWQGGEIRTRFGTDSPPDPVKNEDGSV